MKKIIVGIFFMSIFLFSCNNQQVESKSNIDWYDNVKVKEIFTNVTYTVVVIDSCEYIIGTDNSAYNGGFFLTHKGNCKFCAERNKNKTK